MASSSLSFWGHAVSLTNGNSSPEQAIYGDAKTGRKHARKNPPQKFPICDSEDAKLSFESSKLQDHRNFQLQTIQDEPRREAVVEKDTADFEGGDSSPSLKIRNERRSERPADEVDLVTPQQQQQQQPTTTAAKKKKRNRTPFQCKLCHKSFQSRQLVQDHMWRHTGKKRHVCLLCSKNFSQQTSLQRHVLSLHPGVCWPSLWGRSKNRSHDNEPVLRQGNFKDKSAKVSSETGQQFGVEGRYNQISNHSKGRRLPTKNWRLAEKDGEQQMNATPKRGRRMKEKPRNTRSRGSFHESHLSDIKANSVFALTEISADEEGKVKSINGITARQDERAACRPLPQGNIRSSREIGTLSMQRKSTKGSSQSQKWQCGVCLKNFCCKSLLKDHSWVHTGVKLHRCHLCKKTFTQVSSLYTHLRGVHCLRLTMKQRRKKRHRMKASEDEGISSENDSTAQKSQYSNYIGSNYAKNDPTLKNFLANRKFRDTENLDKGMTSIPELTCHKCGKVFDSKFVLREHTRLHDRIVLFTCEVCKKSFLSIGNLKSHRRLAHDVVEKSTADRSPIKADEKQHVDQWDNPESPCYYKDSVRKDEGIPTKSEPTSYVGEIRGNRNSQHRPLMPRKARVDPASISSSPHVNFAVSESFTDMWLRTHEGVDPDNALVRHRLWPEDLSQTSNTNGAVLCESLNPLQSGVVSSGDTLPLKVKEEERTEDKDAATCQVDCTSEQTCNWFKEAGEAADHLSCAIDAPHMEFFACLGLVPTPVALKEKERRQGVKEAQALYVPLLEKATNIREALHSPRHSTWLNSTQCQSNEQTISTKKSNTKSRLRRKKVVSKRRPSLLAAKTKLTKLVKSRKDRTSKAVRGTGSRYFLRCRKPASSFCQRHKTPSKDVLLPDARDGKADEEFPASSRDQRNTENDESKDDDSGNQKLSCPSCKTTFVDEIGLQDHMWLHKAAGSHHLCPFCARFFIHFSSLQQHVRAAHNKNIFWVNMSGNSEPRFANGDVHTSSESTFLGDQSRPDLKSESHAGTTGLYFKQQQQQQEECWREDLERNPKTCHLGRCDSEHIHASLSLKCADEPDGAESHSPTVGSVVRKETELQNIPYPLPTLRVPEECDSLEPYVHAHRVFSASASFQQFLIPQRFRDAEYFSKRTCCTEESHWDSSTNLFAWNRDKTTEVRPDYCHCSHTPGRTDTQEESEPPKGAWTSADCETSPLSPSSSSIASCFRIRHCWAYKDSEPLTRLQNLSFSNGSKPQGSASHLNSLDAVDSNIRSLHNATRRSRGSAGLPEFLPKRSPAASDKAASARFENESSMSSGRQIGAGDATLPSRVTWTSSTNRIQSKPSHFGSSSWDAADSNPEQTQTASAGELQTHVHSAELVSDADSRIQSGHIWRLKTGDSEPQPSCSSHTVFSGKAGHVEDDVRILRASYEAEQLQALRRAMEEMQTNKHLRSKLRGVRTIQHDSDLFELKENE